MKKTCIPVALLFAVLAPAATVRFDPASPEVGPFPNDALTVADARQKTGLRVNLPLPDCGAKPAECQTVRLLNELDGFHILPRVSVRFSGPIDPHTLRSGLYLVALENLTDEGWGLQWEGQVLVVNNVIYDAATNTAYAKPDAFMDQHRRYALIVTDSVRDASGAPVQAEVGFASCASNAAAEGYCGTLAAAVGRLSPVFAPQRIVGASVFTTHSATAWLESARRSLAGAPVNVQRTGTKPVVTMAEITSFVGRHHVAGGEFFNQAIPVGFLQEVDRIAFGSFRSPRFLDENQVIPHSPTGEAVGLPAESEEIFFHVFLPKGEKPAGGYPVVLFGHGYTDTRFIGPSGVATTLTANGFAVVVFHAVGHGYGPEGKLVLTDRSGAVLEYPGGGRAVDRNRDGRYGAAEGCLIFAPAPVGLRDCMRQTVVDYMQFVRAVRGGIDLDGDGTADLDRNRIHYLGMSLGAMYGTLLSAVEPHVSAAVLNSGGGSVVEIARWSPSWQADVRALLDRPEGYDEQYVLRYRHARVVQEPEAIAIQNFFERLEWLQASSDPLSWAPHLFSSTLPGVPIKPVLFQYAIGDRSVPNPTQTALVRAANLRETAVVYRHDLARRIAPMMAENPHIFLVNPASLADLRIAAAAQIQAAGFLASGGSTIPDANELVRPAFGADLFETPWFLTEDLNF
ncbi:MAG: alpha/beta hydrolase family protein [Bryobacteraceae bacterium]